MAQSAVLAIKIIADSKQAQGEFSAAESKMSKFRSGIGKAAIPAAIAGAAVLKFGKDSVDAARAAAVEQAKLEAVFKATGDTTGKSAKIAADYASTLSRQIGVDDEVIKAGESKLATFKNVADATSMMNGVFKRTTAAGADLAAAGFGSIESNAVLLGKALNDPTKGMSALTRVGVTLTDQQKKQAEQMQKTGDMAGAQKVILKAVEGQVKGTAKATATSTDKAAVAWGEFMEAFGTVLLPIVDKLTAKFASLADWMNKNVRVVQIIVGVIGALAAAILIVNAAFAVYEATQKVVTAAQWAMNSAFLANPITLVVLAIIALGVAFVVAYKKSKTFRDFVNKMWAGIKAVTRSTVDFFKSAWKAALNVVTPVVRRFGAAAKAIFNALKPVIRVVTTIIKTYFRVAFAVVKTYVLALKAYFILVFNVIKGVVKAVIAVFKGDWRGAFAAVRGIVQAFKQFFVSLFHALPGPVQDVIRKIAELIKSGFSKIKSAASGVGKALSSPFETLYNWIQKVIGAVGDLIGKISSIHVPHIDLPSLPGLGRSVTPAVAGQPVLSRGVVRGGRLGGKSTAGTAGNTFVIQGALDPEAVARQIETILGRRQRRLGRV